MSLTSANLLMLRELHLELDTLIEQLQLEHASLAPALGKIYLFLVDKLQIEILFVETQDECLNQRVFCFGEGNHEIKRHTPQLIKVERAFSFNTPGRFWVVQPIEMNDTIIGTIGLAFAADSEIDKKLAPEILFTVSELIDNFFFSIHISRLKHSLIMGIQSALKNHSIVDSIDGAVYVLKKEVPFKKMILMYSDRELTGQDRVNHLVYEGITRAFDSNNNPHAGLEKFIKTSESCLSANTDELKAALGDEDLMVSYLLDGLIEEDLIGKLVFVPEPDASFSIFSREIIQVFAETLRQRLVDFNRERNTLRKYFSDKVIEELLAEPGYEKNYLLPRNAEIGIIFADISGFTKMSEQILVTPDRISSFIDFWSSQVVARLFPLKVCLDKLVGDCIILLIGPPFYRDTPEQIAKTVIKAAQIIREVTDEVLLAPEYSEIKNNPDADSFGVAIGANFCQAVVGLIGPNDDLTAFSSGMNATARLQSLAQVGQILISERLQKLLQPLNSWQIDGPFSAPVKNIQKPLVYYQIQDLPQPSA